MKKLLVSLLAILMAFSLVCCTSVDPESEESSSDASEGSEIPSEESDESEESEEDKEIESEVGQNMVIYPEEGSKIILANEDVHGWWSTYKYGKTDSGEFYRHEDIYYPNALTFSWVAYDSADYYRFFISTDKDFATDKTEGYIVNTKSLTLSHLFTGTKYYWKVVATKILNGGDEYRDVTLIKNATFRTEKGPRCFKIDGVSNTRDIGGLEAMDGYRIKQGMIYRGGKLENITDEAKEYFLNYIGVTTDLDLRTPGEGGAGGVSPLGSDINYINLDGRYYVGSKGINTEEGKEIFAQEIRVFANPDNYPIYIHCSLGRDRTGTIVMVLQGLLGVGINDIMKDYEFSIFSVTGTQDNASIEAIRNNITATYNYIKDNYEGDTFAERTENYLLSIGITAEEIQTIRTLLLEEVK